jgi:hypothetical protein
LLLLLLILEPGLEAVHLVFQAADQALLPVLAVQLRILPLRGRGGLLVGRIVEACAGSAGAVLSRSTLLLGWLLEASSSGWGTQLGNLGLELGLDFLFFWLLLALTTQLAAVAAPGLLCRRF